MKNVTVLFLLILLLFACKESESKKKITQNTNNQIVKTTIDSTDLFYYLVPGQKKGAPVVIFLDPHGEGKNPIEKYKDFALEENIILVGLTNVRNNQSIFLQGIEHAVQLTKQTLKIEPEQKIYIAGFSGGARMAFYSSTTQNFNGILMCGAGPGNLNIDRLINPLAIITGTQDFNFAESYYPPESNLTWQKKDIISIHYRGKHEWPPLNVFQLGITFLFNKTGVPINKKTDYLTLASEKEKSFDILEAYKLTELGYKTCNENEQNEYITKLRNFSTDKIYKNYFYKLNIALNHEMKRNRELIDALQTKDLNWWENEYDNLINKIKNTGDHITSDSYARSKALLGVFLFSKTNNAIKTQLPNQTIMKFLSIYEMFEPENPDVFYFKALNNYRHHLDFKDELSKAFELGFSDKERLTTDFGAEIANDFSKSTF